MIVARIRVAADKWLQLDDAERLLSTTTAADVPAVIAEAERIARQDRCIVAGFVTYEAAAAFDLRTQPAGDGLPLAWFACVPAGRARLVDGSSAGRSTFSVGPLTASETREQFAAAFAAIKEQLAAGETYQVNHTFRLSGPFSGSPDAFFAALVANQRGRYAAMIQTPEWTIASASPELFFAREAADPGRPAGLEMRPMKGTAPRQPDPAADRAAGERLRASGKERAENVMIVDMVRNDLGRIAERGTVAVPALFQVEPYPTVWQMTSTVTAQSSASLAEIFRALHPCASVTGAPKVRTMELIAALERQPRGVYTGAIGYMAPDGAAQFAVAIRTAVITHRSPLDGTGVARSSELSFGVGSGIVWESELDREYDECLLKARVLTDLVGPREAAVHLLETMKWTPEEGFVLLDRHLQRLVDGAAAFEYQCDVAQVRTALAEALRGAQGARRVRLLLAADGVARVEHTALVPTTGSLRLAFAAAPIDTSSGGRRFLVHKTTRRDAYNQARATGGDACDDVVLWNAAGHVTETTVCNIVLDTAAGRLTPPLADGLLAGTLRAQLLADGVIREGTITVEMLRAAGWCWVINSVHGWRRGVIGSVV